MGLIVHHGIIVTGMDEDGQLTKAHAKARKLFGAAVSPLVPSPVNDFLSFLVAPDGSKEGWTESIAADATRDDFVAFLEAYDKDNPWGSMTWGEVRYGADDDSPPALGRHSSFGAQA